MCLICSQGAGIVRSRPPSPLRQLSHPGLGMRRITGLTYVFVVPGNMKQMKRMDHGTN